MPDRQESRLIQVIQRAFNIIEILAEYKKQPLQQLADLTKLNKSTLCSILKSLSDLGYVQKDQSGNYLLSDDFFEITEGFKKIRLLSEITRQPIEALCRTIKETCVAVAFHRNERYKLAEAEFENSITVNKRYINEGRLLSTATGKVLLAYQNADVIKRIITNKQKLTDLQPELQQIRDQACCVILTPDDIYSFAVPVLNAKNKLVMTIGTYFPSFRLEQHDREKLLSRLRKTASEIALKIEKSIGK